MLVLTAGLTRSPRSTAFLASRPAPTITVGFEVFVQLVMAAITTDPSPTSVRVSPNSTSTARRAGATATAVPPDPPLEADPTPDACGKALWKLAGTSGRGTRSCG